MTNPLPSGPFALILADPPWGFATCSGSTRTTTAKAFAASGPGSHAGAADHYSTMPLADLQALPVAQVAAPDAVLAMWIVGSYCAEALALAAAWGFTFKTDLFYWLKTRLRDADQIDLFTGDIPPPRISMGYYTRKQLEPCWLFTRGRGLRVRDKGVRQLIIEPPREHSRKPDEQYPRLESLFGAVPRLELFARTTRPGWSAWGNQTTKFAPEVA